MLEIAIYNPRQHRQFQHAAGPLMLARAHNAQSLWMTVDHGRADRADALLQIVPDSDGIALAMAGCAAECHCGRTGELTGQCYLPVPAVFAIGDTRFEITDPDRRTAASRRPLERLLGDRPANSTAPSHGSGPAPATLSRWFTALGNVNRWATSLQELYIQAARCAVESIGLDGAVVLRRRDERWEIAASHLPHPELGIHCDLSLLDQLLDTPETLYHGATSPPQQNHDASLLQRTGTNDTREISALLDRASAMLATLDDPEATDFDQLEQTIAAPAGVIAPATIVSPLRNAAGELAGAIYGYRSVRDGNSRRGIRYLEAHLIELLAGAVSDGIARLEHEAEVDRRRVLMEQSFAAQAKDPQQLAGSQREVTLLFVDLRGSTALAQSLESEQMYELMGQVMDCLTAAVMSHDGLVIDYYGDGLAAMWNAPADQADHPELACRAALRMMETLPEVAANWADVLPGELRLGIGVNTGNCRVGNAGSTHRLKYGPRGTSVNLASRVEVATKQLALPVLVTEATAARLSNQFRTFRVCRAQLSGIDEPVNLYGICARSADAPTRAALDAYDQALRHFEAGHLTESAAALATIDPSITAVPARFLTEHIQQMLSSSQSRRSTDRDDNRFSAVIQLNAK